MYGTLCKHKPPWKAPAHALPVRLREAARACRGGLLAETVVAVMVYTLVGSAVLAGLSTAHISGAQSESQSIAENVARNQMEYLFSLSYQDPVSTYPSIAVPSGYGVSAQAEEYEAGTTDIEKVVVTVSHNGEAALVVETLRTRE